MSCVLSKCRCKVLLALEGQCHRSTCAEIGRVPLHRPTGFSGCHALLGLKQAAGCTWLLSSGQRCHAFSWSRLASVGNFGHQQLSAPRCRQLAVDLPSTCRQRKCLTSCKVLHPSQQCVYIVPLGTSESSFRLRVQVLARTPAGTGGRAWQLDWLGPPPSSEVQLAESCFR